MRIITLLGLWGLLTAALGPTPSDKLEGTWTLELRVANGSEFKEAKALQYRVKIDGGKWTTFLKGRATDTDMIVVDADKDPRTIDRTSREDKTTQYGIYKLEGGTLTVAFGTPGAKRPEKFESAQGSNVSLSVYKREK